LSSSSSIAEGRCFLAFWLITVFTSPSFVWVVVIAVAIVLIGVLLVAVTIITPSISTPTTSSPSPSI